MTQGSIREQLIVRDEESGTLKKKITDPAKGAERWLWWGWAL